MPDTTEIKVTTLEAAHSRITEADTSSESFAASFTDELVVAYKHIDNQRKRIKYLEGLMWPGGEVVE